MDFNNTDGGETGIDDKESKPLLARQSSLYYLTFDELQSTLGEPGKDFGSMNMDELLKNIWTAEEKQAIMIMTSIPTVVETAQPPCVLQKQGSLNFPTTTLGHNKTVDEVWKNLNGGNGEMGRQESLGETTLKDFFLLAGVVKDNYDNNADLGFEFGQPNQNSISFSGDDKSSMILNEAAGSGLKVGGTMQQQKRLRPTIFPKQANGNMVNKSFFEGGGAYSSGTSSVENNTWSSPPVSYVLEKVVERRQKRMIKNRESAARSRARKQAYTLELEAEIQKLKQVNQDLQIKQAEIMKTQQNELKEPPKQRPWVAKRECLRRTLTGPW